MARGACVRDCMESGVRTVERRSGEGLWHEVWGCRNVEIGSCKSLSHGGNVCQYLDVSIRDQERAAHWHPAVPDAAVVTRAPLQWSLQWVMALQGELPQQYGLSLPQTIFCKWNKLLKITPLYFWCNFRTKVGHGRTWAKKLNPHCSSN